jgi:TonB-linked SusC/RagA family outer membrane protein
VTDASGTALPGVTVRIVIGASNAAQVVSTDAAGKFTIGKLKEGFSYSITLSYIGYASKTIEAVPGAAALNIVMQSGSVELNQVVVTALGISKEKKSLGYAVQQLKGADLNEARDNNLINALSGKVAGVNIISSAGVGSSARITIRGESSLNYQGNQPLIIIDGVPVANDPVQNNGEADYGNSLGAINPADIESLNVLKGPAAAALYGSRAANGALVITTKTGKTAGKFSASIVSGFTWETALRLPRFQNAFGGGDNGIFEGSNFGYSNNGLYPAGQADGYDESWGPRLDGSLKKQFDSPTTNGFRGADVFLPNRGDIIPTPWIAQPNNVKDFFETGHTRFNSVSLSGNREHGHYRFSYTNRDQKGIVPNNNLTDNTFRLNTGFNLTERLTIESFINYVHTSSTNRPDLGYGRNKPMYFFVWMPRQLNIESLRNYWTPGLEGIRQFQSNYEENHNNPFFYQYESTNGQDKDALAGNVKLNYKFDDHLSVMLRGGTDYFNDFRPRRIAVSSADNPEGYYEETTLGYQENNYDFLLNYRNRFKAFNYNVSVGGNRLDKSGSTRVATAPKLLIPGIYTLSNSAVPSIGGSYDYKRQTNSLYGFVQADYKNQIFLEVTGRNDWSSTLPAGNNSYFYPSVSTSILINEIARMPKTIDLLKLRLAYASVGNDTGPYNIFGTFNNQGVWNGQTSIGEESGLRGGSSLKPELSHSIELGTEVGLFKNRLGLDITYYKTNTKNQILNLQNPISSGYYSRVVNAGEVSNKGLEVVLSSRPLVLKDFSWNLNVNFAKNISKVVSLAAGVDKIVQAAPGEDATLEARVGERMGALYGPGFQRVESGEMKGEIIIGSNGRPVITANSIYLGNVNPDYTIGISNRFSYKNLYAEGLLDISQGGVLISRFLNKAMGSGVLEETAEVRLTRPAGKEYDADAMYYRDGAALMPNGSYQRNLSIFDGSVSEGIYATNARDYYKRYYDHNSEAQLIDRSFVKLRELRIGYTFNKQALKGSGLQNITVSLVGRNLALWTENKHFDPETGASTGGGLIGGFENLSIPSTKSYGFNVAVNF